MTQAFIQLMYKTSLLAALLTVSGFANAQFVFFPTQENDPDSILALEDLLAQCVDPEQRAVFEYHKYAKLLAWYRSEWYTPEDERKMTDLAMGIKQKDTGRAQWSGYSDIRDIPHVVGNKPSPFAFSRENYPGFVWASKARPNYTSEACSVAANELKAKTDQVKNNIPETFPEIKRFEALTDPDEFLSISRIIGSCKLQGYGESILFIGPTSFDAWVSNNFSKSYGTREVLSRPLLKQLSREMTALGGMAKALTGFSSLTVNEKECAGLSRRIDAYYALTRVSSTE